MLAGLLSDRVVLAEAPVADRGLPAPEDARWVANKESFYKCQFALTCRRLDFHDAEVVLLPEEGAFEVDCAVPLPGLPRRWSGRYAVSDQLVLTAVELPPER